MEYKQYPIFRFDDVCINADMDLINEITDFIQEFYKGKVEIMWGVSPLVHDTGNQRVYPEIFNAMSDIRNFYKVECCGLPEFRSDITMAGHGLFHVDHRLLDYSAQEMSIIASCSLVGAKTFIPPFNKWNNITESICGEHDIQLIKFEDGWLSMEHNTYRKYNLYYLHARAWTLEKIQKWFGAVQV